MWVRCWRVVRHGCCYPWRFAWLNARARQSLQEAVAAAELGHGGEVVLVIERTLPLDWAWQGSVRARAEALFASLRVWETKNRSGVLVYVNLLERRLELVVDEGIRGKAPQALWQVHCDEALMALKQGQALTGLLNLVARIGQTLRAYEGGEDVFGNELDDGAHIL